MQITRYTSPLLEQNMYIVSEGNHCFIIDPYYCDDAVGVIGNLKVDFMLVTHEHYDHISGVNKFKDIFGCKLIANEKCNKNLQKPTKNFSKYFEAYCKFQKGLNLKEIVFDDKYSCVADETFTGELLINWCNNEIFLKEIPGHSYGGNLIFLNKTTLFSGDTLLDEDIPAAKFPGGDAKAFNEVTVPYINTLEPDIEVYPGHGDTWKLCEYYGYHNKEEEYALFN